MMSIKNPQIVLKSDDCSIKNNIRSNSYHESLDHLLLIPGVGHVAPDTYSGYGSLLDSDIDDDTEATSALHVESNTIVPDSVIDDVPDLCEKIDKCVDDGDDVDDGETLLKSGRSAELSPLSKKFNKFVENFLEKKRRREAENIDAHVFVRKEVTNYADMSPKSKKFDDFYNRSMKKFAAKRR